LQNLIDDVPKGEVRQTKSNCKVSCQYLVLKGEP